MSVLESPPLDDYRLLTEDDLPSSDGIPMDNERQRVQMELLIETLHEGWKDHADFYVGGNMFVYFSPDEKRRKDFRGPDVFVALGVPKRERKSWVVWQERKPPDVVIEVLSESTESDDRNIKKSVYQNQLRVPEYYWHDPFDPAKFSGFRREHGVYVPLTQDQRGRIVSQQLGLALVLWDGIYKDIEACWLRWAELNGTLLPTTQELLDRANIRAAQETDRAEQERTRAEQQATRAEQEASRAEQEAARAEQEASRAEQEAARAKLEAARAEQERERADRLAAMLRALGANLEE